MALTKKTLSIPFQQGLDEKSSFVMAQPGSLSNAENATLLKTGQISKRSGFDIFKDDANIYNENGTLGVYRLENGTAINTFGNQLVISDGQQLYTEYGNGAFKRSGDFLNCEFKNNSVYNAESQKVGHLKLHQFTISSVVYNLLTWVQVEPVGALSDQNYTIYAGIKSDYDQTWVRQPQIVDSISRDGGITSYQAGIQRFPSLHLTSVGSDAYIVYSKYDGSTNNDLKLVRLDLTSLPSLTSLTISTLQDNAGTPADLTVDDHLSSIAVDASEADTSIYVAYHNYSSPTVSTVKLAKFRQADLNSGNFSFHQQVDVTTGVNIASADISDNGFAIVPGLGLRCDPDDSYANSLVVYYQKDIGGAKAGVYAVYGQSYDPSDLTLASTEYKFDKEGVFLHNATHCELSGAEVYSYLTVIKQPVATSSQNGHSGLDTDSETGGLQSSGNIAYSSSPAAAELQADLLVTVDPSSSGINSSPAVIHLGWNDTGGIGTHGGWKTTILEPGSGFIYDPTAPSSSGLDAALDSAETTSVQNQITAAIEAKGPGPSYTSINYSPSSGNFDPRVSLEAGEVIRPLEHTVYFSQHNRGSSADKTMIDVFQNATIISDVFKFNPFGAKTGNGTGLGQWPYIVISRTNGNQLDFNTCDYLVRTERTPTDGVLFRSVVGAGVSTESSLNLTDDYLPRIASYYRLADGISRVTRVGTSGLGLASKFLFGSNKLLTQSFFTKSVTEASAETFNKYKDQVYVGTITEINLDPARDHKLVDAGNAMLGSGGVLYSYDGVRVVENGFYEYPSIRSISGATSGYISRLQSSKTYSVSFVYEYVDSQGNIHESVTTPVEQVELGALDSIIIAKIYGVDITTKHMNVRVTMYRTDADGVLLKKVASSLLGDATTCVTFVDRGETEEEFSELPVIYTTGGVLDNYQPGSVTDITEHKGRIFVSTPTEFIRYSKPLRQGEITGYPIPQFVIDVPGDSASVSGISSGMNFLTVFTRKGVFVVQGEGPNAVGQGFFNLPNAIAENQGALPGSPHLDHSFGVFYVSDRGLYLVTPQAQVQYVGAPVEDLVNTENVKDITLFDYNNEIRFASASASSTKVVLIYNTFFKQWTNWGIYDGESSSIAAQTQYFDESGNPNNSHLVLLSSGRIIRQSSTLYQDETSVGVFAHYNLDITLNNLSMAGLQAAQRVYRAMVMFQEINAATIIQLYFTTDQDLTENHQVTALNLENDQVRVHLTNQKSKFLSLRIRCAAQLTDFQGVTLNGIAFEVGSRAGTFKLPAAQTAPET